MAGTLPVRAFDPWAAYDRPAGVRMAGWLAVLGAHAALLALWWVYRPPVLPASAPRPVVWLQLQPQLQPLPVPMQPRPLAPPSPALPPREPPPRTPAPPRPVPVPQPVQARPAPTPAPTPATQPPAVVAEPGPRHADSDEWIAPDTTGPTGPTARRAPSDYAAAVKSRVIAQVVYPANALYPAPRGFKGDPRELMRQCTVPYEVVVDAAGQIVSYDIERCGDDLLDAAAEAAVLKAQPFPPPPGGAGQYRIYGSINFIKPRLDRATGSRP